MQQRLYQRMKNRAEKKERDETQRERVEKMETRKKIDADKYK